MPVLVARTRLLLKMLTETLLSDYASTPHAVFSTDRFQGLANIKVLFSCVFFLTTPVDINWTIRAMSKSPPFNVEASGVDRSRKSKVTQH